MAQTNDEKKDVTGPQAPQEAQAPAAAPAPAPAPAKEARRGGGGFGRGGGQGQRRRRPGGPGGRGRFQQEEKEFIEKVVAIKRVAKVVKGGRRFSFSALVVAGDGKGKAGIGFGKAKEISEAIRKALGDAKKNFFPIPLVGTTIPHEMIGHFKAARVLLKPASPGTGVIAGGPVRALCEAGGIKDILTKSLGSDTAMNVLKAAVIGLKQMRRERAVFTTGEATSETK